MEGSRRPTLHVIRTHPQQDGGTKAGASRLQIMRTRLWQWLGAILNERRVPGAVQPMSYDDPVTGYRIEVKTSSLFTIFRVNGRDYYFNRFTGHFAGTGQGCA